MKKIEFTSKGNILKGNLFLSSDKSAKGILLLHGGGTATKERFTELQEFLFESGFSSFAFDFQGVGESGGEFISGCLINRIKDAEKAYDEFRKYVQKVFVIGTSMGGHIAVRLTQLRSVNSLILLYAAAYAKEAEDKLLNEEFSKILRTENSWQNSPVFPAIKKYAGKVLIVYGESDTVIPKAVQREYKKLIKNKGKFLTLPDAGHLLLNPQNELQQFAKNQLLKEIIYFLNED